MIKLLLTFVMIVSAYAGQATYRRHDKALLPDLSVTPGMATNQTKEQVCSTIRGKDERHVTPKMKNAVCVLYGLKTHCYGRDTYEIDHLISRELGGVDNVRNLWPQPYYQHPGAHEKDVVENWLHKQVCSDKITLADAQKQITQDWYTVYLRMKQQ